MPSHPTGSPACVLSPLRRLLEMEALSDEDLDNQLQVNKIRADAPYPSVESLLHAFLPYRFVDHTHADTLLALTNQERGPEIIREALGPKAAVLPYARSGLPMARALRDATAPALPSRPWSSCSRYFHVQRQRPYRIQSDHRFCEPGRGVPCPANRQPAAHHPCCRRPAGRHQARPGAHGPDPSGALCTVRSGWTTAAGARGNPPV